MIPRHELIIDFARSGGPGGQNVNKTSTKVIVRWCVGASQAFSDEQKFRIRHALRNRLNLKDEIVLSATEERSQSQNKELAIARLDDLVHRALIVRKTRRPTRPTRASKIRRLENKTKRSAIKKSRRAEE